MPHPTPRRWTVAAALAGTLALTVPSAVTAAPRDPGDAGALTPTAAAVPVQQVLDHLEV